jgi:putative transposase
MTKTPDHPHKGWHSRGYLPHLDSGDLHQAITFRLADALPRNVIDAWKRELVRQQHQTHSKNTHHLRRKIARYEDAGHGCCLLRNPSCASIVQNALLHFDGIRYRLLEWCVMPNHVHVLIHCPAGSNIGALVQSWKCFSSRCIKRLLPQNGSIWAHDYHDRYIRDQNHMTNIRNYIQQNPVAAGLCRSPEDWPWGSARHSHT